MKRMVMALALVGGLGLFGWALWPREACASGCGFKPFKPFTPMGCKDLVAVCVCDSNGQNCHWQWHCVK